MSKTNPMNVLVAMLPKPLDWNIVREQNWYRIPKKSAPPIVRNKEIRYIAFYHTSIFGDSLKYKTLYYAPVAECKEVARRELFPLEPPNHPKANQIYYKISFNELLELPSPFVSRRGHRITFLPTTEEKFFSGKTDFNQLFKGSPLEETMAEIIDNMGIEYEREWRVDFEADNVSRFYILDFAIFCHKGNIDVECDGDAYHTEKPDVHYDKTRNNILAGQKWSVLRYSTKHFQEELPHIRKTIYKTIQKNGGALKASEPGISYLPKVNPKNGQIRLFP